MHPSGTQRGFRNLKFRGIMFDATFRPLLLKDENPMKMKRLHFKRRECSCLEQMQTEMYLNRKIPVEHLIEVCTAVVMIVELMTTSSEALIA